MREHHHRSGSVPVAPGASRDKPIASPDFLVVPHHSHAAALPYSPTGTASPHSPGAGSTGGGGNRDDTPPAGSTSRALPPGGDSTCSLAVQGRTHSWSQADGLSHEEKGRLKAQHDIALAARRARQGQGWQIVGSATSTSHSQLSSPKRVHSQTQGQGQGLQSNSSVGSSVPPSPAGAGPDSPASAPAAPVPWSRHGPSMGDDVPRVTHAFLYDVGGGFKLVKQPEWMAR
jgi:hypothetical protein